MLDSAYASHSLNGILLVSMTGVSQRRNTIYVPGLFHVGYGDFNG